MSMTALSMKLLVDTSARRVLFAEANKDGVDYLFSILALPIGTAIKLLGNERTCGVGGSTGSLYASVEKLDTTYLESAAAKAVLLGPATAPPPVATAKAGSLPFRMKSLVRGVVTYTVLDDLTVTPSSAVSGVALLNAFAVKDMAALQEKHVQLAYKEVSVINRMLTKSCHMRVVKFRKKYIESMCQNGRMWIIVLKRKNH
jgi:hypothetical protein